MMEALHLNCLLGSHERVGKMVHSMLGEIDFRLLKLCAFVHGVKVNLISEELGLTFKPSFCP